MNASGWLLALLVAGGVGAAYAAAPLLAWEGRTMGTYYRIQIAGVVPDAQRVAALRGAVEQRFAELNRQMSHYLPDSELARFNASTSTAPVKVSAEFAQVVRHARAVYDASGGTFDPTLGRLIDLWGFGPAGPPGGLPDAAAVAAARRQCGGCYLHVTVGGALQKDRPGLQLNLGGVAKGFAADAAAQVLRARGYSNFFVAVSGEIVVSGVNAEGGAWRVGIETPVYGGAPGARLSAIVPLSGGALSTSGDAHNFFRGPDGRVYAHLLDPRLGRPVTNNLASVTVIAADGLTADSLTKPPFILGLAAGLRWIEARPDCAALFIVREPDGAFRLVPSRRFPAYTVPPAE